VKKRGADLQKTSDALLAEIGERQRAEEALGASEQRLQDILDNTTAVVFVKDLDLRYILVNREYERRGATKSAGKPTLTFILMMLPRQYGRTIGM
jgi:PAS domain-containing protein